MPEQELFQRIKAIVAREWHVAPADVPDDAELNKTPKWDSLGHITLLLALHQEFGIDLTADTVQELVSLPRIVRHLEAMAACPT
jgi:acyl carrier protein